MHINWVLLILAIFTVVVFDLTNGFHDSSNMIATLIASRAMTQALLMPPTCRAGFTRYRSQNRLSKV